MSKKKDIIIKYLKFAVAGLLIGIANGLFGSGGGTIAVPVLVHIFGTGEHKAHASAISIILPLTIFSSILYLSGGFVDWGITVRVTVGGLAGGWIGAKLLGICPDKVLRKVFAVFLAIAGIRMLIR